MLNPSSSSSFSSSSSSSSGGMCVCWYLLRVLGVLAALMVWTLAVLTYYNSSFIGNHQLAFGLGYGQAQAQGATSSSSSSSSPSLTTAHQERQTDAQEYNMWAGSQICDRSQPMQDDGRYYVASDMLGGGYNNQWNTLANLFQLGVVTNRSVILPPMVFTQHFDSTQSWESIYDMIHVRHPTVTGFRVVSWTYGMRQCHCRLVSTTYQQDDQQDYSPAAIPPKCIWTPLSRDGWITGTMPHPPPDPNIYIMKSHCIKHNVVVGGVELLPWLSSLLSSLVSFLGGSFVGIHLRLGDFRPWCAGLDPPQAQKRLPELANVCPLTTEILDAVQRYCQQTCLLHHHNNQHNSTLLKTCTKQQQQTYTCHVLIATNTNIADKVIETLHNSTILFQQQQPQLNFVMRVKYVHVSGLIREHDLTSSLRSTWSGSWMESRVAAAQLTDAGIRPSKRLNMSDSQVQTALHDARRGPHLTAFELAVLEQYVLSEATFFLGNTASTWSRWVYHRRIARGVYNGWFTFHRWNECADWRVSAQDRLLMDQASKEPKDYYRPRIVANPKDDLFAI